MKAAQPRHRRLPPRYPAVFDIAAQRADVISLGVGEPDFVTPWRVREAGIYALEHGATPTPPRRAARLRELICAELAGRTASSTRRTGLRDHRRGVRRAGPDPADTARAGWTR